MLEHLSNRSIANKKGHFMTRVAQFLAVTLLALISTSVNAADINDVQYSTWYTTYQDNAGTFIVNATVQLNGNSGTYTLSNGETGLLTGLVYSPLPNDKVGVYGTWRLRNESGGFTFRVTADGSQYSGSWAGSGNKNGTWSGSR
jgi:hypothetical protein